MKLHQNYQGASDVLTPGGARKYVQLDNYKRNARFRVKLSATVRQTVAPGGIVKNFGSLFGIFFLAVNENGTDTVGPAPGWTFKQLAETDAGQPLDFARLPDPGVALPIGVYPLYEEFDIGFARSAQAIPSETTFLEADPTAVLRVAGWLRENSVLSLVAPGGTTALENPQFEVTQVDADAEGAPLPIYKPGLWMLDKTLAGASGKEIIELKVTDRLSDIVIYGEADDATGGTVLVNDVINSLLLQGSGAGQVVIGPSQTPYKQLVNSQREFSGGDVAFQSAIYQHRFMPSGMLSDAIDPRLFSNFQLQMNVALSAGATATRVHVGLRTLTIPTQRTVWRTVAAVRPAWAAE